MEFINKLLFSLISISVAYPSYAELSFEGSSCTPVQLDVADKAMAHIPVRNQGNLKICYAETAAELVDAYRFSHGDLNYSVRTSGFLAAEDYSEERSKDSESTGNLCKTVDVLRKKGICSEDSSLIRFVPSRKRKAFLNSLQDIYSSNIIDRNARQPASIDGIKRTLAAYQVPASYFPQDNSIAEALNQKNIYEFKEQIIAPSCTQKRTQTIPIPACAHMGGRKYGPESFFNVIEGRMSSNNAQPIGVSYCDGVLKKGRSYRGLLRGRKVSCLNQDSHASLIIGRRKDVKSGNCQYRIRNSWGEQCQNKQKLSRYSSDWECDAGNIWVDRDAFLMNIRRIEYLNE